MQVSHFCICKNSQPPEFVIHDILEIKPPLLTFCRCSILLKIGFYLVLAKLFINRFATEGAKLLQLISQSIVQNDALAKARRCI